MFPKKNNWFSSRRASAEIDEETSPGQVCLRETGAGEFRAKGEHSVATKYIYGGEQLSDREEGQLPGNSRNWNFVGQTQKHREGA